MRATGGKTSRRARAEIAALAATGLGKFVVADGLGFKLPYILLSCLAWSWYVVARVRRSPGQLEEWGLTRNGLAASARRLAPYASAGALACLLYGLWSGRMLLHWHMLPLLVLYPPWGLVQQFLIVALVAGNLRDGLGVGEKQAVAVTALVFAAVHLPSIPLVLTTFVMALVTTSTWLRNRSLYPLGVFHGTMATLIYYLVLGEDPWVQFIAHGLWV
jgi:hypothetical protein